VEIVHIVAMLHTRAPMVITTHAGSTSPRGGTNPLAQAETTAQRAGAAAAATAPADSDDRLPTYSGMADHLPAVPTRSPHARPHKGVLCRPQPLGRGEWCSRCCLGVCYTTHTCLPLDAPSSEVALLAIIWISTFYYSKKCIFQLCRDTKCAYDVYLISQQRMLSD
jgi:hypothetical protein